MLKNINSSAIYLKTDFLSRKSFHFFDFIELIVISTVVLVIAVFNRALVSLMSNKNANILKRVSIVIVSNLNAK